MHPRLPSRAVTVAAVVVLLPLLMTTAPLPAADVPARRPCHRCQPPRPRSRRRQGRLSPNTSPRPSACTVTKFRTRTFWLREKNNPAVLEHLKAENTYTAAVMAPFKAFEDKLYNEMLGRIKQTDVSVPYPQRGYWLYARTEEGKQYPILCRKKGSVDAPEEVVLDVNKLAEGQKFMALGDFEYSDDNTMLAYSTDINGHRDYDFHLRSLATGEEIKTPVGKVAGITWTADNKTIFYVTEDPETKRSDKVYRYKLGEKSAGDGLRGQRRAFRRERRAFARRGDHLPRLGQQAHHGIQLRARRSSRGRAQGHRCTRRNEIEYYPEHREDLFLHPHQRRRERVPCGHGAGILARGRAMARTHPGASGGQDRGFSSRSKITPC